MISHNETGNPVVDKLGHLKTRDCGTTALYRKEMCVVYRVIDPEMLSHTYPNSSPGLISREAKKQILGKRTS